MSRGAAILLGAAAAYAALYYTVQLPDAWHAGDFAAIWSYGQVLQRLGAATLYDPAALHQAQTALGLSPDERNPFPYPPGFLPIVWPLGWAGFGLAFVVWTGLTGGLYLWACGRLRWVALLVPGTTIGVIAGQTGFLSGALFLGGLRLVALRPWLAGVLFGLLTFKPQLGVLVPVALLAMRAWRTIAAAIVTAGMMTGLSLLLFGGGLGTRWLEGLPAYAADFAQRSVRTGMMPTVTANLAMLGAPAALADVIQAGMALLAAGAVWTAYRADPVPAGRVWLLLAAATFLATPHAFVYDLPLLTGAALAYGAVDGCRRSVMVAVLALPAAMLWSGPVPLSTPVLAAVVVLLWLDGGTPRRLRTASSSTSAANTATAATRMGSSSK